MDKDIKRIHLRFNLADEDDKELWEWLHSDAPKYHKSLNAFMIWELNRLKNGNTESINEEVIAERVADVLIKRLGDRALLTNNTEDDCSEEQTTDDLLVSKPVESIISDDAMDFMNGF